MLMRSSSSKECWVDANKHPYQLLTPYTSHTLVVVMIVVAIGLYLYSHGVRAMRNQVPVWVLEQQLVDPYKDAIYQVIH